MAVLHIDGKPYEIERTDGNLLHALLSLGFDVPYFCWHPALGSVGACRQCAVKAFRDPADARGQIVMSCMTPVRDGLRVSIDDPAAKRFRKSVIEWLMLNHPHDCPICDEGGQCHLQDMTVLTGHNYRTTRFPKRTHQNQNLGPFLHHEMNRCIQCYRCVRFYREYADGRDLVALGAHDHVYFGRDASGTLDSEFAGNLAEVCPTGVFTDKPARARYARKWDLTGAPSICAHCGVGCHTFASSRYGRIVRTENRYSHEINGYFLCDRGRFAREFVVGDKRLRAPLIDAEPVSVDAALTQAKKLLGARTIGIGSPRASLETNFALRELVGENSFFGGASDSDARLAAEAVKILRASPAPAYSLRDIEDAEAAIVLGEDVASTAPRLALALRQTARREPARAAAASGIPAWQAHSIAEARQDRRGPVFIATPAATRLDDIAAAVRRAAPADIARLGFAVAAALADPAAPADELAAQIANAVRAARRTVVVAGLSFGNEAILHAADRIARALRAAGREVGLYFVQPEPNTFGLALLGGRPLSDAFAMARRGEIDAAVVVENDLFRRAARPEVDAFFDAVKHVAVLDSVATPTTARAAVVLPAATVVESAGTLVSNELRAQRFFAALPEQAEVRVGWRWLDALSVRAAGRDLDELDAALAAGAPALAKILEAAPPAAWRVGGQRVPRQTKRFSGRTAMNAARGVHEPKPPADPDSALAFSMEGAPQPPPALTPFYWAPHWNSVQSLNKFQQEVAGPLRGPEPGARLPAGEAGEPPTVAPPAPFAPRDGEWLATPAQFVFGSDELSALSPPIAARIPEPFAALNSEAAAAMGAAAGETLVIEIHGVVWRAPLAIDDSLPPGVAALWAGPAGAPAPLPAWARLRKEAVR